MTAKILRDQFEQKLADLQNTCPHIEVEELPYSYAPGHFAGMVTVCKVCEKTVDSDVPCE